MVLFPSEGQHFIVFVLNLFLNKNGNWTVKLTVSPCQYQNWKKNCLEYYAFCSFSTLVHVCYSNIVNTKIFCALNSYLVNVTTTIQWQWQFQFKSPCLQSSDNNALDLLNPFNTLKPKHLFIYGCYLTPLTIFLLSESVLASTFLHEKKSIWSLIHV